MYALVAYYLYTLPIPSVLISRFFHGEGEDRAIIIAIAIGLSMTPVGIVLGIGIAAAINVIGELIRRTPVLRRLPLIRRLGNYEDPEWYNTSWVTRRKKTSK